MRQPGLFCAGMKKTIDILKNENIIESQNNERGEHHMELAEIVMNPVRQRIFQYLLLHETGTVKEIRKALPDVPGASLYRHMKLLTESGILTVVGENRIRGTVESIYSLNRSALEIDDDGTAVQTALLGLSASFARYFSGGGADPRRDMLLMTTCTLTLTDEEFTGFLTEINQTALKYMDIGVKEGSRQRQITLISSPTDGPGSR